MQDLIHSKLEASEVIKLLKLEPHPEGGHFRQTFLDSNPKEKRKYSTAIYYLLCENEISHWHRIDATEIWHWYAGAPLALSIANDNNNVSELILSPNLDEGHRPQLIVPRLAWQSAKSLGTWTLTGCTVAPAFEFSGFELAKPNWNPNNAYANY